MIVVAVCVVAALIVSTYTGYLLGLMIGEQRGIERMRYRRLWPPQQWIDDHRVDS